MAAIPNVSEQGYALMACHAKRSLAYTDKSTHVMPVKKYRLPKQVTEITYLAQTRPIVC